MLHILINQIVLIASKAGLKKNILINVSEICKLHIKKCMLKKNYPIHPNFSIGFKILKGMH